MFEHILTILLAEQIVACGVRACIVVTPWPEKIEGMPDKLIVEEPFDNTLAVRRVDRSRTLSALIMTLPAIPDEPAARIETCWPTAKSVAMLNELLVPTGTLSA